MLLLKSGLDAAESGLQVRAEALHDSDDRDRDTGGNQAVLDGGCARLIFCKAFQEGRNGLHCQPARNSCWWTLHPIRLALF